VQITLYDEAGQWLGNYSASGDAQQQAIWLDNYPVALINVPAAGVPELAYIQPDHLGTPRVVIDPVRDVAIWEWSNKSEVFGNQIPSADPDGDGVAYELALRFPGQQATDASGMFYNYQREYDPAVGRYSQSDPIGLAGGISSYSYVSGAPIGSSDPSGLRELQRVLQNQGDGYPGQSGDGMAGPIGAAGLTFQFMDPGAWLDPTSGNAATLSAVMNAAWLTDDARRSAEYKKYKEIQQEGYQRDDDPCKNLRNRIEFLKDVSLRRHAWGMKWMAPKCPGGRHLAQNFQDWARLKILEEQFRKECPNECE